MLRRHSEREFTRTVNFNMNFNKNHTENTKLNTQKKLLPLRSEFAPSSMTQGPSPRSTSGKGRELGFFFRPRNYNATVTPVKSDKNKKSRDQPEHLWSRSTSCVGGVSPSAPTGDCTLSKNEATALADVQETIAPHLILHARSARFLMSGIS